MSFVYDANMESPEELRRKREMYARLLANGSSGIASNLGEGIAQFGQALAGRIGTAMMDKKIKGYQGKANSLFQSLAPKAPAPASDMAAKPASIPTDAGGMAPLIAATAADVGIDPVDLATAISYETAGTFDPMKKGPTTKWGTHRGLIQFGEPQAKEYGVDWNDPVGSQLGAGKAVAKYLKKAGVKPGMGLMDVYSAINAGRVGRYGASDAAAGGAPGTVADKVNQQMGGHRNKAQALMAALMKGAQGGSTVATLPFTPGSMSAPPQTLPYTPGSLDGVQASPLGNQPNVIPASAPAPMPESAPMGMSFNGMPSAPQPPAIQPPQQITTGGDQQVQPAVAPGPQGMRRMTAYERMRLNAADRGMAAGDPTGGANTERDIRAARMGQAPTQGAGLLQGLFGGGSAPQGAAMPAMAETAPTAPAAPAGRLQELERAIYSPYFQFLEPNQQKFIMDQYQFEREQAANVPDPLAQRKSELEIQKLERDLNPPAKPGFRPATPEEKRAYGVPESLPAEIGPDGRLSVIKEAIPDQSKPGYSMVSPEEAASLGLPPGSYQKGPDGKISSIGKDGVTVNVGGGSDKQVFDETKARADAARAAGSGLNALNEAARALPGAITGAAANERLALQKIGALFGVGDVQAIQDTETFRSAIAPQVAAMMRATVGSTQISNADREFAEKAAAGAITLDAGSIQRLLNIMRAANSEIVRGFNRDLDKVYPQGGGFDRERALFNVPNAPKAYTAPIGPQAPERPAPPPEPRAYEGPPPINANPDGSFAEPTILDMDPAKAEHQYQSLPSGTVFLDPEGNIRRKP